VLLTKVWLNLDWKFDINTIEKNIIMASPYAQQQEYLNRFENIFKLAMNRMSTWEERRLMTTIPTGDCHLYLYYGNYGGPLSKSTGDPVDALDLACMLHDKGLHRRYFKGLVKIIRQYFDGRPVSEGALSYMDSIDSILFSIVEFLYMNTLNKLFTPICQ